MTFDTGHVFKDQTLLKRALTHASAAKTAADNNERLEFLGDRVLNLLVAELLSAAFPREREGDLAKRLTSLVCAPFLADIGREIGLDKAMRLSSSEAQSGGAQKQNLLADMVEAVIAAIYIDGGIEAARAFVTRHWTPHLHAARKPPQDPKSALQEWAQGRGLPLPTYDIVDRTGPDHAPVFTISVQVQGYVTCTGQGPTRRDAEKDAAQIFLASLT